jgi:AcrR family transcriptional regulator
MDLKTRIIEKATHLFFEMGYSTVTTAELADELGISKKTLYKLFPSKMMLLRSVIRKEIGFATARLESVLNKRDVDLLTRIKTLFDLAARQISKMSRVFRVDVLRSAPEIWEEINAFRRRFLLKRLALLISEGTSEGLVRRDVDERLIVLVHQVVMEEILNPDQLLRLSTSPLETFEELIKILYGGILTEEGRKKLFTTEAAGRLEIRAEKGAEEDE